MKSKYLIIRLLYRSYYFILKLLCGKKNLFDIKLIFLRIKWMKMYGTKISKSLYYTYQSLKKTSIRIHSYINDYIIMCDNNIVLLVQSQYPGVVAEIFGEEVYKLKDNEFDKNKQYVIFDIGANHGYASLYFAQKSWVKNIYAFELLPPTYYFAQTNLLLNSQKLRDKIQLFDFGLGNENKEIKVQYLKNRDGENSINDEFLKKYPIKEREDSEIITCQIKQCSQIFKQIIEQNNIENIILKIDVEGAEYEIMQDLIDNYPEIFNKIDYIVGETHLGYQRFIDILPNNSFKEIQQKWCDELKNDCIFGLAKKL